jgi:hypothetical protein
LGSRSISSSLLLARFKSRLLVRFSWNVIKDRPHIVRFFSSSTTNLWQNGLLTPCLCSSPLPGTARIAPTLNKNFEIYRSVNDESPAIVPVYLEGLSKSDTNPLLLFLRNPTHVLNLRTLRTRKLIIGQDKKLIARLGAEAERPSA